jgi:hypothetical protein
MELILIAILLPELLMIVVGVVRVVMSFIQCGDIDRLIPRTGPRSGKVSAAYWGRYTTTTAPTKTPQIVLPKIVKLKEPEFYGKDWNG